MTREYQEELNTHLQLTENVRNFILGAELHVEEVVGEGLRSSALGKGTASVWDGWTYLAATAHDPERRRREFFLPSYLPRLTYDLVSIVSESCPKETTIYESPV